jgi:hypothetical protein
MRKGTHMSAARIKSILAGARALGPYLLVELVLPGGTLIAGLMWLAQHWREKRLTATDG